MFYYAVHLPLNLGRDFHFCSEERIIEGARVLVSFNRRDMIGICGGGSATPPDSSINYKPVLEVLDRESVLKGHLLKLAQWMAEYYHCSLGSVIFAMLPGWLIPDIDAEIKWISEDIPKKYEILGRTLADGKTRHISELRQSLRGQPVLKMVEEAANDGLLELKRKLSSRDKPKIVNYVRLLVSDPDLTEFPARQKEILQILLASGKEEVSLAELSNIVSYSVIHALAKKGMLEIFPRKIARGFFEYDTNSLPKSVELNSEQLKAIGEISQHRGSFQVHLLYGITGSGKTEVYIPLIRSCLEEGKNVIFLIPEIALTPQMVERFQAEFGSVLAISHSQLSDRQRLRQWQKIARGECRIVIGARSAVFSPMPNLGLIIVDEEHEQSYKQDSTPRYNGRDVAIVRARLESVQVILGSATPSLESWQNQQRGRYRLHTLFSRPLNIRLPKVKILSLQEGHNRHLLLDELVSAINARLERGEQVILFQNRRGFSSFMQCLKCGELIKCPNCEISMYYHRDREEMHCHYCGNAFPSPRKCPKCGSFSFSYGAAGTQKVEQDLKLIFPKARILRLDSDSARRRDSHKTMYRRMKDRDVDILLGTQMISKGLDFPNVTLVGIVNADVTLNVPDFRSAERAFQLCTQVAGRAGRADKTGEVFIQTHNPKHYSIVHASRQDYPGFASEELSYRKRLNYPPYYRLARILYQCADASLLQQEMDSLAAKIPSIKQKFKANEVYLLGPTPAPFVKLNNLFRQHVIIKAKRPALIRIALLQIESCYSPPKSIQVTIDVDPLSLM